jgi:hypothetical protein
VPRCPEASAGGAAWTGPRGGACSRPAAVADGEPNTGALDVAPWECPKEGVGMPAMAMVEYGTCEGCVQLDECATEGLTGAEAVAGVCNDPEHRLCVVATGKKGWTGEDCANRRQAFVCSDASDSAENAWQADGVNGDFKCRDPNPFWPGDFVCGCANDETDTKSSTTGYNAAVAEGCGANPIFTANSSTAVGVVTVRAAQGRLSALSVFLWKSILYGAFVWARRALKDQKRRFPARAELRAESVRRPEPVHSRPSLSGTRQPEPRLLNSHRGHDRPRGKL